MRTKRFVKGWGVVLRSLPLKALLRSLARLPLLLLVLLGLAPPAGAEETDSLVIMTYNIHTRNYDVEAIAQVIRESGADIVLIQEVTDYLDRDLTNAVADVSPYAAVHIYPRLRLGLGAFSRTPILNDEFTVFTGDASRQRLQIDAEGRLLTFYNIHLANPTHAGPRYNPAALTEGVSALLEMIDAEPAPLVVAGDFNTASFSADYQRLADALKDGFGQAGRGLGFTYPADSLLPVLRIDYVFHSDDLSALQAEVLGDSGGSDHYPVRVELGLAGLTDAGE